MESFHHKLQAICESARQKTYPKEQIIIYAGDPPTDVYIVKSGYVKVYDIDDEGNEKVLSIIKPGDVMPYAFFSGSNVPNRWFYQALDDTDVCVLNRDGLIKELKADPDSLLLLVNGFSLEVHELLVRLSSLGKSNIHDKILALMRYFAVFDGDVSKRGWMRVPYPVNQQLMADITGMTRESCSTAIKELVDEKLVRQPKINVLEINVTKLKETE